MLSALGPLLDAGVDRNFPKAVTAAAILLGTVFVGLKVESFKGPQGR